MSAPLALRPCVRGPGRSRSASATACSHSSAPTVRTSASSSSSLTFTASVAGRPVGQEALRSERRRTQELDGHANALDRPQQLLDAPARDAISPADRLQPEGEALADGIGPRRPRALGMSLDLAHEGGRKPRRDPLKGVVVWRGFGPARARGQPSTPALGRARFGSWTLHRIPSSKLKRRLIRREAKRVPPEPNGPPECSAMTRLGIARRASPMDRAGPLRREIRSAHCSEMRDQTLGHAIGFRSRSAPLCYLMVASELA